MVIFEQLEVVARGKVRKKAQKDGKVIAATQCARVDGQVKDVANAVSLRPQQL
jgi:hypothetical protein